MSDAHNTHLDLEEIKQKVMSSWAALTKKRPIRDDDCHLQAKLQDAQRIISEMESEIVKSVEIGSALLQQTQQLSAQKTALESANAELQDLHKKERAALVSDFEKKLYEIEQLKAENNALTATVKKMRSERSEAQNRLLHMESELQHAREELNLQEHMNSQLKKKVSQLLEEVQLYEQEKLSSELNTPSPIMKISQKYESPLRKAGLKYLQSPDTSPALDHTQALFYLTQMGGVDKSTQTKPATLSEKSTNTETEIETLQQPQPLQQKPQTVLTLPQKLLQQQKFYSIDDSTDSWLESSNVLETSMPATVKNIRDLGSEIAHVEGSNTKFISSSIEDNTVDIGNPNTTAIDIEEIGSPVSNATNETAVPMSGRSVKSLTVESIRTTASSSLLGRSPVHLLYQKRENSSHEVSPTSSMYNMDRDSDAWYGNEFDAESSRLDIEKRERVLIEQIDLIIDLYNSLNGDLQEFITGEITSDVTAESIPLISDIGQDFYYEIVDYKERIMNRNSIICKLDDRVVLIQQQIEGMLSEQEEVSDLLRFLLTILKDAATMRRSLNSLLVEKKIAQIVANVTKASLEKQTVELTNSQRTTQSLHEDRKRTHERLLKLRQKKRKLKQDLHATLTKHLQYQQESEYRMANLLNEMRHREISADRQFSVMNHSVTELLQRNQEMFSALRKTEHAERFKKESISTDPQPLVLYITRKT